MQKVIWWMEGNEGRIEIKKNYFLSLKCLALFLSLPLDLHDSDAKKWNYGLKNGYWLEVNWALLRLSVNIVSQSWDIIALSLHALKEILLKIQAKWANGKLRTYIRKIFKILSTAILKFSRNIQLSFQTFTPDSLQCWSYLHTTDLWQCECV